MTQFQHTLKALLEGRKTETSRIIKGNQLWYPNLGVVADSNNHGWNNRTVWAIGKDYAIVPRRGVHSVGRYRVEAIWRQDVRTLTREQAKAEQVGNVPLDMGSEWKFNFLQLWTQMHDKKFAFKFDPQIVDYRINLCGEQDIVSWEGLQAVIASRPAERYQAWRMTIQVLWPTVDWDAPAVKALQIEPHAL